MSTQIESPDAGSQGSSKGCSIDCNEQVQRNTDNEARIDRSAQCAYFEEVGPELIHRGLDIIPIVRNEKRPHPSLGNWNEAVIDVKRHRELVADGAGSCGIGIKTKHFPAIDLDIRDPELTKRMFQWLKDYFNTSELAVRVGEAPKVLIPCVTDTPFRAVKSRSYRDNHGRKQQVEILGDGQQFVALGIHPKTRQPYQWKCSSDRVDSREWPRLTEEDAKAIVAHFESMAELKGLEPLNKLSKATDTKSKVHKELAELNFPEIHNKLNDSTDNFRSMLKHLDPDMGHDEWIKVGMGLHYQYDGSPEGFEIWNDWSSRGAKYDPVIIEKKWRSFGKGIKSLVTAAVIRRWAIDSGWRNTKRQKDIKRSLTTPFSEIEMSVVKWIWESVIASGKLTLIGGMPDTNKTTLCIAIAAIISSGGRLPITGKRIEKRKVLFISSEDAADDTIKPRLRAAGADMDYVHTILYVNDLDENGEEYKRPFSLAEDLQRLEEEIVRHQFAVLFIDPFGSFFGSVDSHKNDEMRRAFFPLIELMNRLRVAVVGITHLNKSTGSNSVNRFIGSIASIAQARIAYLIMRDEENDARRLMLLVKNNLAQSRKGFSFIVKSDEQEEPQPYIEFDDTAIDYTADDVLLNFKAANTKGETCRRYLENLLINGSIEAKECLNRALSKGYSQRTIERAKKEARIESRREPDSDGKHRWFWYLPTISEPITYPEFPER